MTILDNRL